ncbi:MAG: FkbM family methyltransferase [Chloroflexi bacterium]|nr:FkbM family methyltransferase [Chloroflexota bacterium]
MKLRQDSATGLWFRPTAMDRFIIDEVRAVYAPVPIEPGDVVLDLGAHIGAASRLMLERGAAKVIAVEPDPANLAVLRRNLEGFPAEIIAAVVGPAAGEAQLYSRPDRPFLNTTLGHEPGRTATTVPVVTLGDLLSAHRPAVIKCDVEFGEYGMPELWQLPDYVRVVAMEIHVRADLVLHRVRPTLEQVLDQRAAATALVNAIEAQGFEAIARKEKQAVKPPEAFDSTGLLPMTKSIDATWVRA